MPRRVNTTVTIPMQSAIRLRELFTGSAAVAVVNLLKDYDQFFDLPVTIRGTLKNDMANLGVTSERDYLLELLHARYASLRSQGATTALVIAPIKGAGQ